MRLALMLGQRQKIRVPNVAALAGGVVDGQTQIVADFRPRDAFRLIFVKPRRPFAGEVELRERGKSEEQHQ